MKVAIYLLPFTEVQRGYYEIEAGSLEEAKALADDNNYVMDLEPAGYNGGNTTWEIDDLVEAPEDYERSED